MEGSLTIFVWTEWKQRNKKSFYNNNTFTVQGQKLLHLAFDIG